MAASQEDSWRTEGLAEAIFGDTGRSLRKWATLLLPVLLYFPLVLVLPSPAAAVLSVGMVVSFQLARILDELRAARLPRR